ncbi:sensor histidine kinase [Methanogenium cariaci]|jgi:signal transduction histidine kinase
MNKNSARNYLNFSIGTKILLVFFFIFTLLVCTCSYHGFVTETDRIITAYSENIEQSETAIATAVTLVARGTMALSSIYDPAISDALDQMEIDYTAAAGEPENMDLSLLQATVQKDFPDEVELYIIDEHNVIIETTDIVHQGGDFSPYPAISERLTAIREGTAYVGDPWEQSVLDPGMVRKYAYLPTPDHRYILEIGLFNKQLADPGSLYFSFGDVTDDLKAVDHTIESILLIDTNGVVVERSPEELDAWYTHHPYLSADEISRMTAQVLRTGVSTEKVFPDQERLVHIFLIVYAAVVVYSTEALTASLADTLSRYALILICGLIFAAGVAYIVAYTLGRPVRMIAEDVDEIAQGNLAHEIRRTHGYELRRLEDSIRILVQRLGEDISEIAAQSRALDTELEEKTEVEKRLRDVNRKYSLLSTITRHDILNQLAVLGMYFDLLEELTDQCPELSDHIQKMEQTLKKIEDQLTFARDYESMGLEAPQFQSLTDVVKRAMTAIHAPYLRFTVETGRAEIHADPMLEKVFYNLFENAIRHGGGHLSEIKISFAGTFRETGHITVNDNGDGVATAKKEKIFQRGYGSNTGYGLFLVAEILAITGITIRECGREGKGARFEMDVPPVSWRISPEDN